MTGKVVRLPSAATSHYTIRKGPQPGWWTVTLITPMPGRRSLATGLVALNDRDAAIEEAKRTAEQTKRPYREPRRKP